MKVVNILLCRLHFLQKGGQVLYSDKLLFGMHDVHLYQFSTKSNFASQGIFGNIQGYFGWVLLASTE